MNDRELLELAAKAAGIECNQIPLFGGVAHVFENGVSVGLSKTDGFAWNPLLDDGDALRLAVKLNLEIQIYFNEESAKVYVYGSWPGSIVAEELGELDRYQATRRAIVRAAAEIGRTMP